MRKVQGAAGGMTFGLVAVTLIACGGATPAPDTPPPIAATPAPAIAAAPSPAPGPAVAAAATTTTTTKTTTTPATPAAEAWADAAEKPDGFTMTPLFDKKKSKSSFPKKTVGDADCWTSVGVTGNHTRDYEAIVAACGAPTGLVEYAHLIEGRLHHQHDPRDVYKLPLLGGYCYRYFAVADAGITDLDLLIEKPGGALVGDDKTNSPTAIIESDKPWCLDEDQTLEFHVEVDGPGNGGYTFGVWARPNH